MKSLLALLWIVVAVGSASAGEPERVTNPAQPAHGVERMALEELWRAGGPDERIIFGVIADITADAEGNVYVLDNQLCQVMVFSPRGEHLRDLSRQGEGPGEIQQPTDLVFLPEATLGIVMGYPGRIVRIQLDGTPVENLHPMGDPAEGGFAILRQAQFSNNTLVALGSALSFGADGTGSNHRFLAVTDVEGTTSARIVEKTTPMQLAARKYVEADEYFILSRWALAPNGHIYAALDRNRYQITELTTTGEPVRLIERDYEPRKRSQDEKDRVGSDMHVAVDGESIQFDRIVEDHDECILELKAMSDGSLWVLPPQGRYDQPEEIFETWDLFDSNGTFVKQVAIPLGREIPEGTSFLVGHSLLVMVKGLNAGSSTEEDTAAEPLEVICYRIG